MKLLFRTLITLATLFVVCGAPAIAHIPGSDAAIESTKQVSANEAKRLARHHLVERGYAMRIGAGGARIHSITPRGTQWLVQVRVSKGASVQSQTRYLFVDRIDGSVRETAGSDGQLAAN